MNLNLASFLKAVAQLLSPSLAEHDRLVHSVTTAEAATMLLQAALGREVGACELTGSTFEAGGVSLDFDRATTITHPLLAAWSPLELVGAVEQAILAGAAMTSIRHDGPTFFGDVEFWAKPDGSIAGSALLTFNVKTECTVRLHYGSPAPDPGFRNIHLFTGEGLYSVGERSTQSPRLAHALAQDAAMAVSDFAAAFSPSPLGAVH